MTTGPWSEWGGAIVTRGGSGLGQSSDCVVSLLVFSVSLRLSVRSRALDGLILLLSDSKQMDFIVLRLTGGRLMMSADLGKGPASIASSVAVNDGEWHAVSNDAS